MKKTFKKFLEQKNISQEDFEAMTVKEITDLQLEYNTEQFKDVASKEDLKEIQKNIDKLPSSEAVNKISKDVTEALETLAELKEKTSQHSGLNNAEKYMLRKALSEKHTDIVDAVKNKKEFNLTFKAAAVHMTNNGTVTNGTGVDFPSSDNFMVDNEIAKIRYPENFILNVIPNRQVTKVPEQRIKTEQAPKEGAATLVNECEVKPLIQFKYVRTTTQREKYAGRIEWSEEFAMDFELLLSEIFKMFEQEVVRAWQDGVLGHITSNATTYVASPLDETLVAPDNGLAVVAGQTQLQSLGYISNIVLMNPSDVVSTLFAQKADGDLKAVPYIDIKTGTINGVKLLQSNKIAQGTAYVGDSSLYDEIHSDFILRTGTYDDQLIRNEYTAIGEVFSITQIAERDLVGWLALDLAAVKTSLLKA